MAIKRFAGDKFSGLSTDTKPTNVLTGATFWETDTGATFVYNGSSWQGSPSSPTTLSGQTDVTFTGLANGNLIQFNGAEWVNVAGISAALLSSGVLADGRVQESNVTQHETALSIAWGQVTGAPSFLTDITGESIFSLSNVASNPGVDRVPFWNNGAGQLQWQTAATFADWVEGSLQLTEAQITDLQSYSLVGHTHDAADIISGTMANARIAVGNVTQHEAALTITWAQITGEPTFIEASEKGAANGVATLDAGGLIPSAQLPAIAVTDVYVVADIAARNAISPVEEGDVAIVNDASADPAVDSGPASYIYDGSAWQLLRDPTDASLTPAGANGNLQFNNGAGNLGANAALNWADGNQRLEVEGSIEVEEGGTVVTPARGAATMFVETEVISTDTVTRVMQRLSNGDDVIVASFIEPT